LAQLYITTNSAQKVFKTSRHIKQTTNLLKTKDKLNHEVGFWKLAPEQVHQ